MNVSHGSCGDELDVSKLILLVDVRYHESLRIILSLDGHFGVNVYVILSSVDSNLYQCFLQ